MRRATGGIRIIFATTLTIMPGWTSCIRCTLNLGSGAVHYRRGIVLKQAEAWHRTFQHKPDEATHRASPSDFFWSVLYPTYTNEWRFITSNDITRIPAAVLFQNMALEMNVMCDTVDSEHILFIRRKSLVWRGYDRATRE